MASHPYTISDLAREFDLPVVLHVRRSADNLLKQLRRAPVRGGIAALADAIVEATETGSTLRANRLRILVTVMESNTQLIANDAALADPWKRTKIDNIALLLRAAIEALGEVTGRAIDADVLDKIFSTFCIGK